MFIMGAEMLKIRVFEQEEKWFCGPAVVQSVLEYFGIKMSQKEIAKGCGTSKKYGTSLVGMAIFLKKLGLKPRLIIFDPEIIDPTWSKLSKKILAEKLSKRLKAVKPKKRTRRVYELLIEYLKNNGEVFLKIPGKELITEALRRNEIPIIAVCNKIFYKTIRTYKNRPDDIKGGYGGHIVIVKGYKNGKFFVADPLKQKRKISEDELLFSWFYWGGWMLLVGRGGRNGKENS